MIDVELERRINELEEKAKKLQAMSEMLLYRVKTLESELKIYYIEEDVTASKPGVKNN